MKRSWATGTFLLLITLIPTTYNACSFRPPIVISQGTEITNPMTPTSSKVAAALCDVIRRCHNSVSEQECLNGVVSTSGMSAPLGLPSNFNTLSSISQAEQAGLLVGNLVAGNSCSSAIEDLECDDPRVQTAYNSSKANRFEGTPNMISSQSCGEVFVSPVEYACSSRVFLRGVSNSSFGPQVAQTGLSYSISPSLPQGLALNSSTGVISGTPTVLSSMTAYTITATSVNGSTTSVVHIKTSDGYLVTSLGDLGDQNPGDQVCATSAGVCTLRAALQEIGSGGGADIVLPEGSILIGSVLSISARVNIYGACSSGTTLDGQGASKIFNVTQSNLQISMQDLNLQNGFSSNGGGVAIGNGFNDSAIFRGSRLKFQNHRATGASGGSAVVWWGPSSQFHCSDCIFESNRSDAGSGAATLVDQSNSFEGCLFVQNSGITGAVSDNSDVGSSYVNATFYSNVGTNGSGGVWLNTAGSNHNFVNTTFVNNQGTWGGAVDGGGTVHFTNSILYNNTGANGDCDRATVSHGGNLSTATASRCALNHSTDIVGLPMLGPLQSNGGFSKTLALLPGSPGLDQGLGQTCPSSDQRGLKRPARAACDIGAFEAQ